MKIIIFLALAGLSLAADLYAPANGGLKPMPKPGSKPGSNPVPNTVTNPEACLKIALQSVSELLQELAAFVCKYHGSIKNNKANYEAVSRELMDILGGTVCTLEQLLGLSKESLDQIVMEGGEAVKGLVITALGVLDGLGLTPIVAELLCALLKPLPVECVEKIFANLDLQNSLQQLLCPGNGDVTPGAVAELIIGANCLVNELLDLLSVGDGLKLNEFLENLGMNLDGLVDTLLDTLRELLPILNPILCSLAGLVGGVPVLPLVG